MSPTYVDLQNMDEDPPQLDMYENEPIDATVGWLRKRKVEQTRLEEEEKLNWMFDWQKSEEVDLGEIKVSWAASFTMAEHDTPNEWTKLREITASTKIPLQCWMTCHELWKHGFHVQWSFSLSGFYIHVLIGLPYKTLVEEAEKMHMIFRLTHTKGRQPFRRELIPRFPTVLSDDKTCFSSAHKHGLTLFRMKRLPVILPEVAKNMFNKEKYHKQIKRYHKRGIPIRSFLLQRYFKAFGVYRPNGTKLFGSLIKRIATEVLENPWLVIRPDKSDSIDLVPNLLKAANEQSGKTPTNHEDIGQIVETFDEWLKMDEGMDERFEGQFAAFFALHDKVTGLRVAIQSCAAAAHG